MKEYQVYMSPSDVRALEAGSSTCVCFVKPSNQYRSVRLVLDAEPIIDVEQGYIKEVNRHAETRDLLKSAKTRIDELMAKVRELENQVNPNNSFTEWLHESVKGSKLDLVKITDLKKTVLGLKDSGSDEVFIVGSMHDLTFTLNRNDG